MDLELNGKSIIVTGGVLNIDRAITLALAGDGANVTIADLDANQAAAVLDEVKANGEADKRAMFTDNQFAKIAASLPLKQPGRPKDIANVVAFLSSDAVAGHITGQVLSVSGGYSMIG